jgi:5-formyltetrahydrofolate cyclo-ligase
MKTGRHTTPKRDLRKRVEKMRRALDPGAVARMSEAVTAALLATGAFRAAHRVLAYLPLPGEVRTDPIRTACRDAGKQTFVPAWHAANARYEPARLEPDSPLTRGKFGVAEPAGKDWVPLTAIDLVLVPGVAFDPNGHRLGRGGGYYDRMLAACPGTRIGLAFECQLVPHVPTEPHDIAMDLLVTETGARPCGARDHDLVTNRKT